MSLPPGEGQALQKGGHGMPGIHQMDGVALNGELARLVAASMFGDLITTARIPALVSNDDLEYIAVNEAASKLLGYEPQELLRLTADQVVLGRTRDEMMMAAQVLARDGHRAGTVGIRRADGSTVAVHYISVSGTIATLRQFLTLPLARLLIERLPAFRLCASPSRPTTAERSTTPSVSRWR